MSTSTQFPAEVTTAAGARPRLWPAAIGYGLVAGAATTAVAAAARSVGVSLDVAGEPVVLPAFAELTVVFSLAGLLVAVGIRRWSRSPRRTWVRTAMALTALSFVPDALADAALSTRFTLMLTHLVAAAVVVPALARRLSA